MIGVHFGVERGRGVDGGVVHAGTAEGRLTGGDVGVQVVSGGAVGVRVHAGVLRVGGAEPRGHGGVLRAIRTAAVVAGLGYGLADKRAGGGDQCHERGCQVGPVVDDDAVRTVAGLLERGQRWHLLVAHVGPQPVLHGDGTLEPAA